MFYFYLLEVKKIRCFKKEFYRYKVEVNNSLSKRPTSKDIIVEKGSREIWIVK